MRPLRLGRRRRSLRLLLRFVGPFPYLPFTSHSHQSCGLRAAKEPDSDCLISQDKEAIVAQHARGVFIRECLRDELLYFQHSQYRVSRLCQDWAGERVKYAELLAENFRGLGEGVEVMVSRSLDCCGEAWIAAVRLGEVRCLG